MKSLTRTFTAVALSAVLFGLAGCSRAPINFPYANERYTYPEAGSGAPRLFLGTVLDVRPEAQRSGQGHFKTITYPTDARWSQPVETLYREALTRDLLQTRLVELVPMASQAAYTLDAQIESFHCRMERSGLGFLVPPAVGLLGGFALADDTGGALRRAAVFTILGYGALPLPTRQRAEVIVQLTLRDAKGNVVWEQACLGEIEDSVGEAATSRKDKRYAERYLPQAVKRANACLLGQLRQFLVTD